MLDNQTMTLNVGGQREQGNLLQPHTAALEKTPACRGCCMLINQLLYE